jgi:hypothetical protein
MRLAPGQRHVILQEMGIQTYVPRQPLPGAMASPARQVVRSESHASASANSRKASPAPAALAVAVHHEHSEALLRPTVPASPSVPAARAEAAPTAAVPATASTEAVHFAFGYIPVNDHLAVICELPWARSAVLSSPCRQLLADMLKAIGAPCDADRLSPMVFSWPLAEAGEMPADAQTARHMLEGFVARRLKLRAVPNLLILAEQSAQFLFPAADQPQAGVLRVHPRFPVQVLVTHSLHAMESVRELKRSAWQALQPLKQALADAAAPGPGAQV